jgi:hypothetical protein
VLGSLGGSVALLDALLYRWQQQEEEAEAAARPQSSEADTAAPGS